MKGAKGRRRPVRPWWRRYEAYLASAEWQRTRDRAMRHDGRRCTRCGHPGSGANPLQAAHVSYRAYNATGRMPLPDVRILCRDCHERVDGWRFPDG